MSDPTTLGAEIQAAASKAAERSSVASSNGKPNSSTSLTAGRGVIRCQKPDFAKAIAHLCAMKRTAALSPLQVDVWHGVLAGFSPEVVNASVIELALTKERFPELGDLYQICRREAIKRRQMDVPYNSNGTDKTIDRPSGDEIRQVAERLGLKV